MTHRKRKLAGFTAMLGLIGTLATAQSPGMQELDIPDGWFGRSLDGYVWYPAATEEKGVMAHGNGVWQAIRVQPDAAAAEGRHPLVVLSHGMFGNARNQAWLADALTAEGYIVAAINHPGTSTFSRRAKHRQQLWQRPRDISRVIDHLLEHPELATRIDAGRIFMAGHSMGGMTAVALAGGRFSPEKVEKDCAEARDPLICGIVEDWGVLKTQDDRTAMAADLSDDRIRAYAVFDLGGTQTFDPASVKAIETPLQIWGAPRDIQGLDLDRESRALKALVPAADYHEPDSLAHFDFLGECTDRGHAILADEEPESVFVCIEGTDERRAEHEMIAGEVARFFAQF